MLAPSLSLWMISPTSAFRSSEPLRVAEGAERIRARAPVAQIVRHLAELLAEDVVHGRALVADARRSWR